MSNQFISFEVKYCAQYTDIRKLQGLLELCEKNSVDRTYVITKSLGDFELLDSKKLPNARIIQVLALFLLLLDGRNGVVTNAFSCLIQYGYHLDGSNTWYGAFLQ